MSEVAGKVFKIIKTILIWVIILSVLGVAGGVAYQWYSIKFWTAPEKLDGISLGMSRSDVLFHQGKNAKFIPEETYTTSQLVGVEKPRYSGSDDRMISSVISFDQNDKVEVITLYNLQHYSSWQLRTPFKNTDSLLNAFGEPDLLAISGDDKNRRYTYLDKGYTFSYEYDELDSFMLGTVTWRSLSGSNQKYFVMGKQVCPSSDCPWDDEDNLKEEFKDKDYRYFLDK